MLTETLKESTQEIHQEAEKKMIAQLKGVKTTEDYVHLLNWLYGFYHPVEELAAPWLSGDLFPDMDKRMRADNLLQDMAATGLPLPPREMADQLPRIDSTAKALGALYVLEGSTLGGRVIATMLGRQLGPEQRYTFFNAYGLETDSMWETFKTYLGRPYTPDEAGEIIAAANETFTIFKNWIDLHELQPQL